jgi:hypothetical protein
MLKSKEKTCMVEETFFSYFISPLGNEKKNHAQENKMPKNIFMLYIKQQHTVIVFSLHKIISITYFGNPNGTSAYSILKKLKAMLTCSKKCCQQ